LAEHLLCKERVRSSSLLVSTTSRRPPGRDKNKSATHRRRADRPCVEPCGPLVPGSEPSVRVHRPADCWAGPSGPGCSSPCGRGAPSQVNMSIGRSSLLNELRFRSSSPSRRARQCIDMHKDQYPETIRCNRPLGELLKWSSYTGHGVDALAPGADEGRGRRRNASGSCEQALIRRCPNGETRPG
jgi:hypothetical protein